MTLLFTLAVRSYSSSTEPPDSTNHILREFNPPSNDTLRTPFVYSAEVRVLKYISFSSLGFFIESKLSTVSEYSQARFVSLTVKLMVLNSLPSTPFHFSEAITKSLMPSKLLCSLFLVSLSPLIHLDSLHGGGGE